MWFAGRGPNRCLGEAVRSAERSPKGRWRRTVTTMSSRNAMRRHKSPLPLRCVGTLLGACTISTRTASLPVQDRAAGRIGDCVATSVDFGAQPIGF
jgi:hypothetical protein